MINVQSIVEGEWYKVNRIFLTEEQQNLLKSKSDNDIQAKLDLIAEKEPLKYTVLSETENLKYVELYNANKPNLVENDEYEFIACYISGTRKLSGIINCRINGDHKQIRF
jgi:hypothetical protein